MKLYILELDKNSMEKTENKDTKHKHARIARLNMKEKRVVAEN